MLDTAVRGRISRRRPAIRPERETIAPRLLSAPPAQHSQVIVVAVVLHHQNQNVVDLGKTVRAFWLVREGPLALDRPGAPPACAAKTLASPYLIRHIPGLKQPSLSKQAMPAWDRAMSRPRQSAYRRVNPHPGQRRPDHYRAVLVRQQ